MSHRPSLRGIWVAGVVTLLAVCGSINCGDVVSPASSASGSSGDATSSTSTTGSGSSSSSSGGEACGMNPACAPGSHCLFADHSCGTSAPGTTCPQAYCAMSGSCSGIVGPPACGCDGKVYDNECLADSAGVGTSKLGACGPAPQGRFACGHVFCEKATQFCIEKSGEGCAFGGYECRDLPQGCADAACVCTGLSGECLDGLQCDASADGDITVGCTNF